MRRYLCYYIHFKVLTFYHLNSILYVKVVFIDNY